MAALAGQLAHVGVRVVFLVDLDAEERFEDILKRDDAGEGAADTGGRRRIVVAGDPDPVAAALKRRKCGAVRRGREQSMRTANRSLNLRMPSRRWPN